MNRFNVRKVAVLGAGVMGARSDAMATFVSAGLRPRIELILWVTVKALNPTHGDHAKPRAPGSRR